MVLTINEIKEKLVPIFLSYDVRKASLFVSYARGEANDDSDVDIYVDCSKSKIINGIFMPSNMRLDIAEALGKNIDMITHMSDDELDAEFRNNFYRDEVVVYSSSVDISGTL